MLYSAVISLLAAVAVVAQDGGATVATPNGLTTCQPTLLTWTGGQAPYYVSIIEGGNPNGKAFKTWPATEATSLTWKVAEVPAGQSITVQVKDGSGAVKYSAAARQGP
ncbi:hypothetical protein A1Q2_01828 [Trichosporon asahii var. asahii CBS 8904]|uniref:Secreted protein n=1 Tax=Trichosporon asahii var. asahii (strain CBS 8904) TaxID=1220162 RepID=K1VI58_TRIAC|nr:hypothetical protein A1Q2_01828 [Trichosporon asahii var. asahii CBS 8904]